MKKFLSYLWPITKRFDSEISGSLEVNYINGKKVLDSQNANYSFGKLQQKLELGLDQIDLSNVKDVLVLGMGGGSVIDSLRNKYHYTEPLMAVEIDPEVIRIAHDEFGIKPDAQLKIIQDDAYFYLDTATKSFQLVIVDIFIDRDVPPKFFTEEFLTNLNKAISHKGFLIFNLGIHADKTEETRKNVMKILDCNFNFRPQGKKPGLDVLLIGEKVR